MYRTCRAYLAILSSLVSPGGAPAEMVVEEEVVLSTDGLSISSVLVTVAVKSELLRFLLTVEPTVALALSVSSNKLFLRSIFEG